MDISSEYIQKAVRKVFPHAVVDGYSRFPGGFVNDTYKLDVRNIDQDLVLRKYNDGDISAKALKEEMIYKIVENNSDVSIPKVYDVGVDGKILPFEYMIMSEIPGKSLSETYDESDEGERVELGRKVGKTISDLHQIKFDQMGFIEGTTIRQSSSIAQWHQDKLSYFATDALFGGYVPKDTVYGIMDYTLDHMDLLDIEIEPCLIHNDFTSQNIKFLDGEVSGLFDFEWAASGHNEYEFVKTNWFMPKDEGFKDSMMSEYVKKSELTPEFDERLKLYELERALGICRFSHENGDGKTMDRVLGTIKKHLGIE